MERFIELKCTYLKLFWLFRIISNYEYCEDSFVALKTLLASAGNGKENLNANNVGMLIGEIWGEKVKKIVKSDYSVEYLNLKRRSTVGLHRNDDGIHKFTDDKIKDIRLLCAERPSWRIDASLVSKNTILLMHPFEVARRETIAVDGHCLSMEIKIVLGRTPTIKINTFGQEVAFSEIIGMDIQEISLRTIDEAICVAESASLCIGTTVCSDDESSCLRLEVSGSKVVTVKTESLECQKRLLSKSCLLFRLRTNSCKNCCYTAKLHRNRSTKRKHNLSSNEVPHKKCNTRYLHEEGLQRKIYIQQKERKSELRKEARTTGTADEMIELVDEDTTDLMEIVKSTKIEVPPNLTLLWEQQMTQLSKKSPKGYRWNPRFLYTTLTFISYYFISYIMFKLVFCH